MGGTAVETARGAGRDIDVQCEMVPAGAPPPGLARPGPGPPAPGTADRA